MGKDTGIVGYTTGVFDLFHVGHVNLLRNAKGLCDCLIVGVSTDETAKYKGKTPIIPYDQRAEVVRACRYVDGVVPQKDMNKLDAWRRLKFDKLFVGDDWYGSDKWDQIEESLKKVGVGIIYFPYTQGVSSTIINKILDEKREEISDIKPKENN